MTLSKNIDGQKEEIESASLKIDSSSTYEVEAVTDEDQIQVYVDEELMIDVQDSTFEHGYYGLASDTSTSSFRNVEFENMTNFVSNLSGWSAVNGEWDNSLTGKAGVSQEDAFILSDVEVDNFLYEADIEIVGGEEGGGAGALVFRADDQAENGYFANIDAMHDVVKLMKIEDGSISVLGETSMDIDTDQTYELKVDAYDNNLKVSINDELVHEISDDSFASGQLGLNVWNSTAVFQNVNQGKNIRTSAREIDNHDFETGDLSGWNVVKGNAFTNDHVTDETEYWGGPFNPQGTHHLWGFSDLHDGDQATGELHSSYFKLDGNGEINFLLGAGNDISNRYVSLMRASDDRELIRQTNTKFQEDETYKRYIWDASKYLGEVLYIKAVDQASDGWGHINLDDFNVYNEGSLPEEIDATAEEPEEEDIEQSGTIDEWTSVQGDWVNSTHGSNGGIWECPTLVELPIDGDPNNTKWVLQVSINDGAPAGGSGMQYFVGDFDGETFTNENSSEEILWTDYGADYYAAVEWSGIEGDQGQKYWLGWMSNWQYANETPTTTWRSSMSLPRTMELTDTEAGTRLKQTPVSLNSIRDKKQKDSYSNEVISGNSSLLSEFSGDTYELVAEFDVSNSSAEEFGFRIRKGEEEEYTTVGYHAAAEELFVDRTSSDEFDYGNNVADRHEGNLPVSDGKVKMRIFVDRSAVEVFGNNGETVITDQLFPDPSSKGLDIYSKGGEVHLKSLEIYPLKSIWKDQNQFKSNLTGWESISGRWAETQQGLQGQGDGDNFTLASEQGQNFHYKADIKVLDSDSHPGDSEQDLVNNSVGSGALVFRSDPSAKNAYAANIDVKNNQVKLIKFEDGKGSDLKTSEEDLDLKANQNYQLKVEAEGEDLRVYLDKELVIETKDSAFQEGYFGLNVWDSTVFFNKVKAKVNKGEQ
ncbi:GH32 C-terminal domain-containing protein [Halobacillus sp. A5]|uniref:GH32 C-terminal domain-containing protein n=1 Tax=Halobacillus sp. A5 TaxID=2880263 RepID=UPI0020A6264A|nr:GH32 C-terminal domain-containing protein [Halobacillus sp. A5]